MKKPLVAAAAAVGLLVTLSAQAPPPAKASFAEPGIAPDGSAIAFVSGGDIWEVPARGGDARLLRAYPAGP